MKFLIVLFVFISLNYYSFSQNKREVSPRQDYVEGNKTDNRKYTIIHNHYNESSKNSPKSKQIKTCPPWYEGENCQAEMRQKFYGTYTGMISGGNASLPVTISLTPGKSIQGIIVFWGPGSDGKPVEWNIFLKNAKAINIPLQFINNSLAHPGTMYSDEGSGFLDDNQLIFTWTQKFSTQTFSWTLKATKSGN